MTDLSVLVVSYNAADHLAACLRSIGDAARACTVEVVVVDNASTDGAPRVARATRPDATVIELAENVGFGPAVNVAAAASSAPRLLLLNPDAVLQPGAIDRVVALADAEPGARLYGGVTVSADGAPDGMHCWGLPTLWSVTCFGLGLSTAAPRSRRLNPEAHGRWPLDRAYRVDAVTGAFLLIDRQVWDELGGFDEDYFLYAEDLDLCARARAAGYQAWVTPDARIVHERGASSTGRPERRIAMLRGKVTYLGKRWSPGRAAYGRAMLLCGVGVRRLLAGVGPRRPGGTAAEWVQAWHRRDEWRAGYRTAAPPAVPTGARAPSDRAVAETATDA